MAIPKCYIYPILKPITFQHFKFKFCNTSYCECHKLPDALPEYVLQILSVEKCFYLPNNSQ